MRLLFAIRDAPAGLQAGYMQQRVTGFSYMLGMLPVLKEKFPEIRFRLRYVT